MSLKLNSSGGGSVTLSEPTTASNRTLNLPDANGTVLWQNASGDAGIGTSSPQNYTGFTTLDLAGSTGGLLQVKNSGGTIKGTFYVDGNGARVGTQTNQSLLFDINGSERARIDTSGNLLVGVTSGTGVAVGTTNGFYVSGPNTGSAICVSGDANFYFSKRTGYTDNRFIQFYINSSGVGSITTTGTATAYNTSSDYRLKHDIQPMQNALAKVAALKPCTYKWNVDDSHGEGFIAHELAEVVPGCVTGEKDAVDADGNPVYQGIDTSFLVATLAAAIQELKAIVDTQAAEIAALKGV